MYSLSDQMVPLYVVEFSPKSRANHGRHFSLRNVYSVVCSFDTGTLREEQVHGGITELDDNLPKPKNGHRPINEDKAKNVCDQTYYESSASGQVRQS